MAQAFVDKGYKIISGGTDNHMMLIDLSSKNITGKAAENALGLADITVNKNMVPFDQESPFTTSGIRVGTAAVTTRGFEAEDCLQAVEWIDAVIMEPGNESKIAGIKADINQLMKRFPLYMD